VPKIHDDTRDALLPAAVLWDMDGTLIDSEPYWIAAEQELVGTHGGQWTVEDALKMVGNSLPQSAKMLQDAGVQLGEAEILDFLLDRVVAQVVEHVPFRPGARDLLDALVASGVKCALVTASYRRFAQVVADATGGAISVVVAGDDVVKGKPDPECYVTAARRLGVDPADCVAIEDSGTGLQSALASGARVLGVECMLPIPDLDVVSRARSFAHVTVEAIASIAAGQVLDLDHQGGDDRRSERI
jgi:HAD superfamily hydrolase (TIGR01509 family)